MGKHDPAARLERLVRLLLAPGNAAVINGLDRDRRPGRNHTLARPRECMSFGPVERGLRCYRA